MNIAYLLIGGNMGNREAYLQASRELIGKNCGSIINQSHVYETAAWGMEKQNSFLNQVLQVKTNLEPLALLTEILEIEKTIGRERQEKYGPRIIDIDIIFYNDAVINNKNLIIPHPEMQNRRFVLVPLAELAPGKIHPALKKSVARLLQDCTDKLAVQKFQ